MANSKNDEEYNRVEADHYAHNAFTLLAGAYAWQVHNFWIGLGVLVGLYFTIIITNSLILAKAMAKVQMSDGDPMSDDDPFNWLPRKWIRVNRWFWVIAAHVAIGISGASIGYA